MMKVTLLVVGSLKEHYWKDAEAEYRTRLSPFCKFEIKELKEISFSSVTEKDSVLVREAERITASIPHDAYVIALDREGKEMSSPELAQRLENLTQHGEHLCIVIGGPLGLSPALAPIVKERWTLSHLTFTHQIARVLFVEQLYRSLMILSGKQYHY